MLKIIFILSYSNHNKMESLSLNFPNKDGLLLSARLELPKKPKAFGIYAHCFTCTKNITAAHVISKTLADLGIAMLRFDFMGLGDSEGSFFDSSLSSNIEDILSAATFLEKEFESPKMLIGHSLGGLASLYAAKKIDSIRSCVLLNSPSSTKHTSKRLIEDRKKIEEQGFATLDIMGKHYKINPNFGDDLTLYENLFLDDLSVPLLIMHVPDDPIVPIYHAEEIFKAAHHPKNFIALDKMDHLLKKREDCIDVSKMIFGWVERYLVHPE